MKKLLRVFQLVISVLICLSAGWIGSIFTSRSVSTWYLTINKPIFNPPSWLFAPVWTLLFVLMGIALFFFWKSKIKDKKMATGVFIIQLLLNILWSVFFFGMQNPLVALIEIVILWLFILWNIILFFKFSKAAGILLIPYIAWVSFAMILNLMIVILN